MRESLAEDHQRVDLQRDALVAAGIDHRHLHTDKVSGARNERPGLKACLDYLNAGDTLLVWSSTGSDVRCPSWTHKIVSN